MINATRLLLLLLLYLAVFAQPDIMPGRNHKNRSNLLKETLKSLLGPLGAMLMMDKIAKNTEHDTCVGVLKEQLAAKDQEIAHLKAQQGACEKKREQIAQEYTMLKYKTERERLQEDYNEFKEPDVDDDDVISKEEFYAYIVKSLQEFPNLSPEDFPRFDDFDTDGDGYASFQEWQEFVYGQHNDRTDTFLDEMDALEDEVAPRLYEISPTGADAKMMFDRMDTGQ